MLLKITNEQDFYMIARNFYNNSEGNTECQFEKDIRLINSLKGQFKKYSNAPDTCDLRLMLNYYIVLSNVFGLAVDVMLRYRIPQEYHSYLAVLPSITKGKKEDPNCFSYELYNNFKEMLQ